MSSVQFNRSLIDAVGLDPRSFFDYLFVSRLIKAIEARFKPLEDQSGSLDAAIEAVRKVGLDRINEVLVPAIQSILEIQSKGFLVARSDTLVTLGVGDVLTLVVGEDQGRGLFTPGPFTALTREATPDDYAICRTVDYNQETGVYICQVQAYDGDPGPHNDWVIGALAASTIAGMTLRDQSAAARDAAFGYATAADTARGLAVTAKGAAEAAAGVAGGHASAANTSRGEALGFRNQAEAFAAAAATFDPSNFYTKGVVDAAFAGEATARGAAIATAVTDMAKTTVAQQFTKPQRSGVTALTSASTITIDGSTLGGNIMSLTIAHNATLANPANLAEGTTFSIFGQQDGTGGRTLAYGSNWNPIGRSSAPSIPAAPNAKFRITGQVGPSGRIDYLVQGVGV